MIIPVRRLGGARRRRDMRPSRQGVDHASLAINVDFQHGQITTRRPFIRLLAYGAGIVPLDFIEWTGAGFNRLMTATTTELRGRDLASGTEFVHGARNNGSPIWAPDGSRLIFGEYTRAATRPGLPQGIAPPKVLLTSAGTLSTAVTDVLWPAAPTGVVWGGLIGSSVGAEVITPGIHHVAAVFTTRSGYRSRPVNLGTFTAPSGIGAAIVRVTMPVGLDASWQYMELAFAPVDTPASYYVVPDTFNRFSVGSGTIHQYTFQLDDATLQQTGEELTAQSGAFVQGIPYTIQPHAINRVGKRFVYHADIPTGFATGLEGAAFFTDPGEAQGMRVATSIVQLPDRGPIPAGVESAGDYILFGMDRTYVVTPNDDQPVNWPPPVEISANIGALFQTAVLSSSKRREVYVANPGGAYVLSGNRYLSRPLSYWADLDWIRINWTGAPAHAFKWIEDPDQNRIGFVAPLDGATRSTHVFWWSYQVQQTQAGDYRLDAGNVDYSLMPFPDMVAPGGYGTSTACGLVLNEELKAEFCFVPTDPVDGLPRLYRQYLTDTGALYPWLDDGKWAIESVWATGAFGGDSAVWIAQGASIGIRQPFADIEGALPPPEIYAAILTETPNLDRVESEVPLALSRSAGETAELTFAARGSGLYLRLRARTPMTIDGLTLRASRQSVRR